MNNLQSSNLIAAAIGVTVGVISAASIFIYHKILENRQHTTSVSNLDAANKKIAELQAELEAVRIQQSQKKKRKVLRKFTSNDSTYTITDNDTDFDAFSTADTDIGDDEFYDCSDSESITGDNDVRISEELNELELELNEIDENSKIEFDLAMYEKLRALIQSNPENVEIVWRFAQVCYQYCEFTSDTTIKKNIIQEGIAACEKVIETKHADLFKQYAILIGLNGDYLSTSERIKNGHRFIHYVTTALEMRPSDFQLHHLLGRFKYEVASLSWIEKKIATAVFSGLPSGSYEEAIACFEESERLGSKYLGNGLFLSKAYIALNQYKNALDCLEKIIETPALSAEDINAQAEASKLLEKYSQYRL